MIKSKAIDIIKTLTKEEQASFKDYLSSPFFNKKKKLTELYNLIVKKLKVVEEEKSTEENIFAQIFEGKKFSYSFLRNLMSELLAACERFLIFNNLNKNFDNDFYCNGMLLMEFNRRYLDKMHELKRKKMSSFFKNKKIDFEYYYYLYLLEFITINYHIFRDQKEIVPEHMIARSEYNLCHITQLIELELNDLTAMISYNFDFKKELIFEFIKNFDAEKFLEQVKRKHTHKSDELLINLLSILIIIEPAKEKYFFELKELALKNIDKYSNAVKYNIFTKLKNYCDRRVSCGSVNFRKEKFELLKKELEFVNHNQEGVGPLNTNSFLAGVNYAVEFNELEHIESLVKQYSAKLDPARKESMRSLASAILEFEKNNFENTLKHLSTIEQFNTSIKNICKELYLKTYFEMGLYEQGFSLLDSYAHFIREKSEFTEMKKERLIKGHDFFYKLYKIKSESHEHNEFDLKQIMKDIQKSNADNKKWIEQKVNELKHN